MRNRQPLVARRLGEALAGFQILTGKMRMDFTRLLENSTPMTVKFSAANNFGSAPMSANPNVTVSMPGPRATDPNGVRMRTRPPMSANPNPTVAPFPTAANPEESRAGRRRNNFNLRRRRRARLFHDDLVIRRRLLHDNDAARLAFDYAACEQWQAGGN
jgi:hypothetical protein